MATLAHGPTVLNNPEPCKLVGECTFYALQEMTRTIIIFVIAKNYYTDV